MRTADMTLTEGTMTVVHTVPALSSTNGSGVEEDGGKLSGSGNFTAIFLRNFLALTGLCPPLSYLISSALLLLFCAERKRPLGKNRF